MDNLEAKAIIQKSLDGGEGVDIDELREAMEKATEALETADSLEDYHKHVAGGEEESFGGS